jgi:hypothetical protein
MDIIIKTYSLRIYQLFKILIFILSDGYFSDIDPQNGHADPLVGFISKN